MSSKHQLTNTDKVSLIAGLCNLASNKTTLVVGGDSISPLTTYSVSSGWGCSSQVVQLPEGTVSVDDFVRLRNEINEWKIAKQILEKHQIIDEWPDGDVVIRIKRRELSGLLRLDAASISGVAIVDFGVDEEEK